jgi:branched-chain amino acid transport system substrate-binding protein
LDAVEAVKRLAWPIWSCGSPRKPAGLAKSKGLIIGLFGKDPTDPRWKDHPSYKEWAPFVAK